MGQLTTHVLDTVNGCPAAGMGVSLYRVHAGEATQIKRVVLNDDGRADGPLLEKTTFKADTYRLAFEVAAYFRAKGVVLPEVPFLDVVLIDFGIADASTHYHVPLLASPWGYATYRGS